VRIIGGEWRGRQIVAPEGMLIRPTPDRVREAWMNILQADLPGARVLDLYSGTGALGLEALSRGAVHVDFVENDARALRLIEGNVAGLGAGTRCAIHRDDAVAFVSRLPGGKDRPAYDIALADAPYRKGTASELATLWLDGRFSTILCVEHESHESLPDGGDSRRYGMTSITFYRG
jgi:16S rRNA (guanine966-N2)-methyltransferase